jgi:bifunctional isochorismate lyase / aryl carrier protein
VQKESYYSSENIEDEAAQIWKHLPTYRNKPHFQFSMQDSALLILDMQKYFLEPDSHAYIPSATAILRGLQALAQVFHTAKRPVVFTRHLNTPQDAGMMNCWWRELIQADDPISEIVSEFELSQGSVVQKSQYDAFYQTALEELLRESHVRQVVVGGVMTHLCCETTARAAFVRGFEVFFLIDGTATYNVEFQRSTLQNLSHGFAELITVKGILTGANGPE